MSKYVEDNTIEKKRIIKMIVVKFQGALGNQMFEYAFMRKLEVVYKGCDIYAHIPKIKDFNGYEIENVFPVSIKKAPKGVTAKLSDFYPVDRKIDKVIEFFFKIRRNYAGSKESYLRQDDNTAFYPSVYELNALKSYYMDGVWANAHYLEGIDDIIRKDFVFSNDRGEKNQEYMDEIDSCESVCIHVRRNEYVSMGLSVVSDNYYKSAVEFIKTKVVNPKFYVFSDDHDYCKDLFDGLIEYTLVEGNIKENSYRDMELMSHCKHNIIANSTFSFWGAYLNSNINKIVIAPNMTWGNLRFPFACDDWTILDV